MSINTIIIPAEASAPIRIEQTPGDLSFLQATVGGYVEAVGTGNICIWLDEEGKLKSYPVNRRATKLAHRIKAIDSNDFIVGDVVITGFNANTGENADAPQAAATYLNAS
ncbi:DUF3846 domain-containing protein [Micrococcaceae sp. AOP34-BR2-30]